jgi:hypothetical protein
LDSDTSVPDEFHGFRIADGIQAVRRIHFTAVECDLPIVRLGVFGRASEDCELLLSLHHGGELHLGAAVAPPLSMVLKPEPHLAWHRVEYPAPHLLGPHDATLWLLARVTRGAFWWYGSLEQEGFTQRSADEGKTFGPVNGRPQCHVSVKEVDPATGRPSPLMPLALSWDNGLLNADVAGVNGQEASLPPEFRRFWIAERSVHRVFLNAIPDLGGRMRLTFRCNRDVTLKHSDAVLTYDPWNA